MLRHFLKGFVLLAVASCASMFAGVALAAPTGEITPYVQCADGSETVPAGQLITIRTSWVTYAPGLATDFIKNQRINWTLYGVSAELLPVLASSGPQDYNSRLSWIDVGQVTRSINGHPRNVYEWLYEGYTAIGLAPGQVVRLEYTFEVQKPLNDGLGERTPKGTVYSTSSCVITAV
jgi:hypothetical protein